MGGRRGGRPRLPSAVKKARGTYQKCRAAKDELELPAEKLKRGDPPAWLDKLAREEWRRIFPMLDRARVLSDGDMHALAGYCNAVSLHISSTKTVQKEGITTYTAQGTLRVHPAVKVGFEARAHILRFSIEFGLTPAARSRISAPHQPKLDPEAEKKGDGPDKDDEFLFGPLKAVS